MSNSDSSEIDLSVLAECLHEGDSRVFVTERAEQVYSFPLFSAAACAAMIQAAESLDAWEMRGVLAPEHPYAKGCRSYYCPEIGFPDRTVMGDQLPGFSAMYQVLAEQHILRVIRHLWPVFRVQRVDTPYVIKYVPNNIDGMGLHFDLETVSLVAYLNDDFEGGGTYFPRWSYSTAGLPAGTAILFPGGLSHVHCGLKVTRGVRYVLAGAFF